MRGRVQPSSQAPPPDAADGCPLRDPPPHGGDPTSHGRTVREFSPRPPRLPRAGRRGGGLIERQRDSPGGAPAVEAAFQDGLHQRACRMMFGELEEERAGRAAGARRLSEAVAGAEAVPPASRSPAPSGPWTTTAPAPSGTCERQGAASSSRAAQGASRRRAQAGAGSRARPSGPRTASCAAALGGPRRRRGYTTTHSPSSCGSHHCRARNKVRRAVGSHGSSAPPRSAPPGSCLLAQPLLLPGVEHSATCHCFGGKTPINYKNRGFPGKKFWRASEPARRGKWYKPSLAHGRDVGAQEEDQGA